MTICWTFFEQLLEQFWGPFWAQIGPRRSQDGPKRDIKSSKIQKAAIAKTLKGHLKFFSGFRSPESSQESLRKPKTAPKRHPKSSKTLKNFPKWNLTKTIPELILEQFWGPQLLQKEIKHGTTWNPLSAHLRGPGVAKAGIKREW